jgi:putative holliday junction resolvase
VAAGVPLTVLAFDYGLRRIGVAAGNTLTGTAEPLTTLRCAAGDPDWPAIGKCIADWRPAVVVVGVPYNMDDSAGPLTAAAQEFARALAIRHAVEVVTVDERLSSREAEETLRQRRRAGTLARRIRREDVDGEAARVLLAQWLNARLRKTP